MKTILVTGASGLVGSNVVKHLAEKDCRIIAAVRASKVDEYKPLADVKVVPNEAILEGGIKGVDVVVNCAFARSNKAEELAAAVDFTQKLIGGLLKSGVENVINVSSQGVYKRLPVGSLSTEDSPIEPMDLYSMTKYAVEKMFELSALPCVTNIRLASINMKQRFLYRFVQSAKEEGRIYLNSPQVYASLLDVEDAAEALALLALSDPAGWEPVYNLSIGQQYSLAQYAEVVRAVGERLGHHSEIVIDDNGNASAAGSDNSLLRADIEWKPAVTNEMMVEKMFEM